MAPIDIVQAQAEVASNEQGVIVAEAAIKTAQDNLRALILDPGDAEFLERHVRADRRAGVRANRRSTSTPPCATRSTSARTCGRRRTACQQSDINIRFFRNQIMPDVNAQVQYVDDGGWRRAALRRSILAAVATGGGASRSILADRGFGSVLGDVFQSAVSELDVRRPDRLPARHQHRAREPRSREAAVRAGADAAQEPRDAGHDPGARHRAQRADEPAARAVGAARPASCRRRSSKPKRRSWPPACRRTFFVFQAQRDLAARAHRRTPGDFRLQQVAGRFRGGPAGAARSTDRRRSPPPAPAPS